MAFRDSETRRLCCGLPTATFSKGRAMSDSEKLDAERSGEASTSSRKAHPGEVVAATPLGAVRLEDDAGGDAAGLLCVCLDGLPQPIRQAAARGSHRVAEERGERAVRSPLGQRQPVPDVGVRRPDRSLRGHVRAERRRCSCRRQALDRR